MQATRADIRENEGKREKRRKEEKKEEEEENKKNTPPSLSPRAPLHKKSPPQKKVCGPYIKFVYSDVWHRPEPSLFPV